MIALATTFAEASQRGVAAALLFALTAGFLTALTPCVYPMIPITVAIFGAKQGISRRRAMLLATCYVAGIAALYGALGTIVGLAGKQTGEHLADPRVIIPLALLFVALAASMFGAFELNLPTALQARLSRVGGSGPAGAFMMGLVAGLIAAPCTGPPLAGILAYVSTTRDGARGFTLLATYAAGIGIPFWAIAGLSMSLPKPGRWMEATKSVFGIVMLVTAFYFLRPVFPALGRLVDPGAGFLGLALAVAAAGIALGAVHLSFHDTGARVARKLGGVALSTVGLIALVNWVLTPKVSAPLHWHDQEPPALTEAGASSRPLLVDFRAEWCLPCKEMELKVFSNPAVADELQKHFVLLKVDLTHEDDDPQAGIIKAKYGVSTLPAVRIATAAGATVERLDEFVPPEQFLNTLARVRATP
ncbi:MAG TPA: cytochrome c biogenesis protein CcdA [Polyangia bacterium]|nr:cytochrome c biogenesis protein CcdA [Polyangia bacterium]